MVYLAVVTLPASYTKVQLSTAKYTQVQQKLHENQIRSSAGRTATGEPPGLPDKPNVGLQHFVWYGE
jgi:hypothetical protein